MYYQDGIQQPQANLTEARFTKSKIKNWILWSNLNSGIPFLGNITHNPFIKNKVCGVSSSLKLSSHWRYHDIVSEFVVLVHKPQKREPQMNIVNYSGDLEKFLSLK